MAGPGAKRAADIKAVASTAYAVASTTITLRQIGETTLSLLVAGVLAGGATTAAVTLRLTFGGQTVDLLSVTLGATGAAMSSIDGICIPADAVPTLIVTRDAGTATLTITLAGA